jgi:hypothetical protein
MSTLIPLPKKARMTLPWLNLIGASSLHALLLMHFCLPAYAWKCGQKCPDGWLSGRAECLLYQQKCPAVIRVKPTSRPVRLIPDRWSRPGTDINWSELRTGMGPVVFLVNGFGGCAPCILRTLHDKLIANGIAVYDFDWNDIYRRTQQNNFDLADAQFLQQMEGVINAVPQSRSIVLIGHSFGGDSVLKVAQRTSRRIELLGVLDAVELGGLRTRRSVGSNVGYFYNRWTTNPSGLRIPGSPAGPGIPFNYGMRGEVSCNAGRCDDQNEQSYGYRSDGSAERDACESWEVTCPGYNPIPGTSNGTKHRRITHGGENAIYRDELIQEKLFQKIKQLSLAGIPYCVDVSSKTGWTRFSLPRSFTRVTSIVGGWSVGSRSYAPVGPYGHTGQDGQRLSPYNQYKYDQRFPFGALLMGSLQGIVWIQNSGSLSSTPFSAVDMRINDADNALGDNNGSLRVCFGN